MAPGSHLHTGYEPGWPLRRRALWGCRRPPPASAQPGHWTGPSFLARGRLTRPGPRRERRMGLSPPPARTRSGFRSTRSRPGHPHPRREALADPGRSARPCRLPMALLRHRPDPHLDRPFPRPSRPPPPVPPRFPSDSARRPPWQSPSAGFDLTSRGPRCSPRSLRLPPHPSRASPSPPPAPSARRRSAAHPSCLVAQRCRPIAIAPGPTQALPRPPTRRTRRSEEALPTRPSCSLGSAKS